MCVFICMPQRERDLERERDLDRDRALDFVEGLPLRLTVTFTVVVGFLGLFLGGTREELAFFLLPSASQEFMRSVNVIPRAMTISVRG